MYFTTQYGMLTFKTEALGSVFLVIYITTAKCLLLLLYEWLMQHYVPLVSLFGCN